MACIIHQTRRKLTNKKIKSEALPTSDFAPARTNCKHIASKAGDKGTDEISSTACSLRGIGPSSPITKTKPITNVHAQLSARKTCFLLTPILAFPWVRTQSHSSQQWLQPSHCWSHLSDICGVNGSTAASKSAHKEEEQIQGIDISMTRTTARR